MCPFGMAALFIITILGRGAGLGQIHEIPALCGLPWGRHEVVALCSLLIELEELGRLASVANRVNILTNLPT